MTTRAAYLLIMVGVLLMASGCARPMDTLVSTANTAAVTLTAAHTTLMATRKAQQIEAAKRVAGDRADPAVRAEQLERARLVGVRYRPAWTAYEIARAAWITSVAAIKVAQQTGDVATALVALARLAELLAELAAEQFGLTGGFAPPPPSAPRGVTTAIMEAFDG